MPSPHEGKSISHRLAAAAGDEVAWLRWWASFAIILPLVTWKLWFADHEFPSVALWPMFERTPWLAQAVAAAMMLLAAGGCLLSRRAAWICLPVYAASLLFLWACNQHRLQPWAYQFGIVAAVMFLEPWRRAAPLLRMLVVSIYFYSALGKFDYSFAHTLGRTLLEGALAGCGLDCRGWPESLRVALVLLLPLAELSVAIGLLIPRTRRLAIGAAVLLHLLLLLRLSPWGLNHQPGVLLWNVFFMGQVWLLFGSATITSAVDARTSRPSSVAPWRWRSPLSLVSGGVVLILMAVLVPLLEPWGLCDHWLAWGLYSTRNSRALVELRESATTTLPRSIREHLAAPNGSGWVELDLGAWSLRALAAPVYPQGGFQREVAERLRRRYQLGDALRVRVYGMAERFSGRRQLRLE